MAVNHPNPHKLDNIRVVRRALSESAFMQEWLKQEPETDDQNNAILWPAFVSQETRDALQGFDREKINWALSCKGELVISRILAGYVKEAMYEKEIKGL